MAGAQHGCTTNEFFKTLQQLYIPDEGINFDLEGFDDEEDAGELDALPHEPAIVLVDEADKKIQLQTINIVDEGYEEVTQASKLGGDPAMLVWIVCSRAVRTVICATIQTACWTF